MKMTVLIAALTVSTVIIGVKSLYFILWNIIIWNNVPQLYLKITQIFKIKSFIQKSLLYGWMEGMGRMYLIVAANQKNVSRVILI